MKNAFRGGLWVLFGCLFILLLATPAAAAEQRFAYSNESGYSTTLVLINPTDSDVPVPEFWTPFGVGGGPIAVPAKGVFRFGQWPRSGGGVQSMEIPDALDAYTEISDPNGVIVRITDLGAEIGADSPANFYDTRSDDSFRTFLFLNSPDGSAITIRGYAGAELLETQEFYLPAGETSIPVLGAGVTRAEVSVGWRVGPAPLGTVYAFALVSHQPGGELLLIRGR